MPSPNMNLPIPIPTVTPGAQYAFDEVSCFNTIDAHNHTSGNGVQIPSAGININASLSMNNQALTNAQLINLYPQAAIATNGSLYRVTDDLWFRDGAGNNVRITQGGSVAVSGAVGFTGLPSGTASASYNALSQSFIFESATNTPANIDGASITIRPLAASPQGITLNAPALLAASYSLELPAALPANTEVLLLTSTGSITAGGTANSLTATTITGTNTNVLNTLSIKNDTGVLQFRNTADSVQFCSITASSTGVSLNLPDNADSYSFNINSVEKINCNNNRTEIKGRTNGSTVTAGWIGETVNVTGANNTQQNGTPGNALTFTSGPSLALSAGVWLVEGSTRIGEAGGGLEGFYVKFRTSTGGTLFGFGGPQYFSGGGASVTTIGTISLASADTVQFYIVPNGAGTPSAGLALPNMPCGYIQATRIG